MILDPIFMEGIRTNLEKRSRENRQVEAVADGVVKVRILDAYTLYVDPHDASLGIDLCRDGYWEFWVTQFLSRVIRPGWNIIDVGANFGYYTLLFADLVGESGSVIAVEPNQYLVEFMKNSITENGFGNISIISDALSNFNGKAELVIPLHLAGSASIKYGFEDRGLRQSSITVEARTLDALHLENINLLKIDAEGSEADIIEGAEETIKNNPEMNICMEWLHERIDDTAFVFKLEEKFSIHRILTSGRVAASITARELAAGHVDWDMLYLVPRK